MKAGTTFGHKTENATGLAPNNQSLELRRRTTDYWPINHRLLYLECRGTLNLIIRQKPMPADQPVQRLKPKDIIEGSALPQTKVHFFDHAGVRELDELDTGILFILAWWSAPAHIALDHLGKAILRADPSGKLPLYIVNTDGIPELYDNDLLRGKIHGYGECVFKKRGKVVHTLFRVGEIDDYEDRISQVLG